MMVSGSNESCMIQGNLYNGHEGRLYGRNVSTLPGRRPAESDNQAENTITNSPDDMVCYRRISTFFIVAAPDALHPGPALVRPDVPC